MLYLFSFFVVFGCHVISSSNSAIPHRCAHSFVFVVVILGFLCGIMTLFMCSLGILIPSEIRQFAVFWGSFSLDTNHSWTPGMALKMMLIKITGLLLHFLSCVAILVFILKTELRSYGWTGPVFNLLILVSLLVWCSFIMRIIYSFIL